jgi:hypothetical protein
MAGTLSVAALPGVPVRFRNRALASCRAFESVRVSVTEALETVTSALPTMACSMAVPRFELVVVPQVPD